MIHLEIDRHVAHAGSRLVIHGRVYGEKPSIGFVRDDRIDLLALQKVITIVEEGIVEVENVTWVRTLLFCRVGIKHHMAAIFENLVYV